MEIKYFENNEDFVSSALECVEEIVGDGSTKYISLCGGSTPRDFYSALASSDIDLSNVNFYQTDERYVEREDKRSNYNLINTTLLSNKEKQVGGFHYFDTSLEIKECLDKYSSELIEIPKKRFDLTILGIGPDGHIASLFPDSEALDIEKKYCVYSETEVFDVKERLSVSKKMIMRSKIILILLKGEDKNHIIEKLEEEVGYHEFPAKLLYRRKDVGLFYLRYS